MNAMRLVGLTAGYLVAMAAMISGVEVERQRDAGAFVRALWAVQRFGKLDAADPHNDERTKALLAKSLEQDDSFTAQAIRNNLMDAKTFHDLAGDADRLSALDVRRALDQEIPASRRRLLPGIAVIAMLSALPSIGSTRCISRRATNSQSGTSR